jgi:hypothetical protein
MIAQFITPIIGGEEQYVINLSRELVRRGHQVAIATIRHSKQSDFEIDAGVRISSVAGNTERINCLYKETPQARPPFPTQISLALAPCDKAGKPEIVHGHNWLVYSYLPTGSTGVKPVW